MFLVSEGREGRGEAEEGRWGEEGRTRGEEEGRRRRKERGGSAGGGAEGRYALRGLRHEDQALGQKIRRSNLSLSLSIYIGFILDIVVRFHGLKGDKGKLWDIRCYRRTLAKSPLCTSLSGIQLRFIAPTVSPRPA